MDKVKKIVVYVSQINSNVEGGSWAEVQEKLDGLRRRDLSVAVTVIWSSKVSMTVGGDLKANVGVMGFFRLGLVSEMRTPSLSRREEVEHILVRCEL